MLSFNMNNFLCYMSLAPSPFLATYRYTAGYPLLTKITFNSCHSVIYRYFTTGPSPYLYAFGRSPRNKEQELNNYLFYNIITSIYILNKNKPLSVFFNLNDLYTSVFKNTIISSVAKGSYHTVLIKVRYASDSFFMLENQIGFDSTYDYSKKDLLAVITTRHNEYGETYDFTEKSIDYFHISFKRMNHKFFS